MVKLSLKSPFQSWLVIKEVCWLRLLLVLRMSARYNSKVPITISDDGSSTSIHSTCIGIGVESFVIVPEGCVLYLNTSNFPFLYGMALYQDLLFVSKGISLLELLLFPSVLLPKLWSFKLLPFIGRIRFFTGSINNDLI